MQRTQGLIFRTLLTLAVGAVALLALWWTSSSRLHSTADGTCNQNSAENNPSVQVLPLTGDDVQSLNFERGAVTIRLERAASGWRFHLPDSHTGAADANPFVVGRVLQALSDLRFARLFSANELPAAGQGFGFEKPRLTLHILANTGQWSLVIGTRQAISDQVYVRSQDPQGEQKIGLVVGKTLRDIDLPPGQLRDRRVLAVDDAQIATLIFTLQDHPALRLDRDDKDPQLWQTPLAAGQQLQLSVINDSLSALRHAQWHKQLKRPEQAQEIAALELPEAGTRTLEILAADKSLLAKLNFYPLRGDQQYIGRALRHDLVRVDDTSLDQLPRIFADLVRDSADPPISK